MIPAERTALVLLAAGLSRRFGEGGSKLDSDLWGRPVGLQAPAALAGFPFLDRVAVVRRAALDYAAHGFRVVRNDDPEGDLASSIRFGIGLAIGRRPEAALIVLADMPLVTAAHVDRLLQAANESDAVVASQDGLRPSPPALFGRDRFDALLSLRGDRGARDLLAAATLVPAAPDELVDVDTPEDMDRLRIAGSRNRPSLRR